MAMKKIAIIGLSESRHDAPWTNPEWEMWGLPWDREYHVLCDRLFEMHKPGSHNTPEYWEDLADMDQTVYMREKFYPNAIRYPIEDVIQTTGDWFASSIAYMIALAIHEHPDEIGIWGVEMNENYAHQKPNAEYLLWIAKHQGITLHLHESCPLMRGEPRYGE